MAHKEPLSTRQTSCTFEAEWDLHDWKGRIVVVHVAQHEQVRRLAESGRITFGGGRIGRAPGLAHPGGDRWHGHPLVHVQQHHKHVRRRLRKGTYHEPNCKHHSCTRSSADSSKKCICLLSKGGHTRAPQLQARTTRKNARMTHGHYLQLCMLVPFRHAAHYIQEGQAHCDHFVCAGLRRTTGGPY